MYITGTVQYSRLTSPTARGLLFKGFFIKKVDDLNYLGLSVYVGWRSDKQFLLSFHTGKDDLYNKFGINEMRH